MRTEMRAVLFADICGSTELYNTLGDTHAKVIVDETMRLMASVVPARNGRVIKTIGDEIMCVFPDADDAVLAACDMQALVSEARPAGRQVHVHIGLHYGPVLVSKDDLHGDTVNVAGYLTAVAAPDQICTTASTEACLSDVLKKHARPVFRVVLKGSKEETTIFQITWENPDASLTDIRLAQSKVIPPDPGHLLLTFRDRCWRVGHDQPRFRLGRDRSCDIVVPHRLASRWHCVISLQRTHFYLIDESINGTFVTQESGEELHVLRREILLSGIGTISLGSPRTENPRDVIRFEPDRDAPDAAGPPEALDTLRSGG